MEVWDASGRLDTVWLDNFECPESYSPAIPPEHFTAVLRATEGVEFHASGRAFPDARVL